MTVHRQIILHVLILAAIVAVFELTDIDLRVQDRFFDFPTGSWLVNRREPAARLAFYTGAKGALIALGVVCVAGAVLAGRIPRLRPHRRGLGLMALSLIFVPLLISGFKSVSNTYTPAQITRYGGQNPYVKPLERYPAGFHPKRPGRGYPAGHASGGFALMMLYFAARRPRWKWSGLALGLAAGWAMGLYQTLNGQHYLSHTLVTQSAAWILILLIRALVDRFAPAG